MEQKYNSEEKQGLRDAVLGRIEAKGIAPKPKWHFLLKEGVVWAIALGALLLGVIATSLTMYIADSARFIMPGVVFTNAVHWVRLIPIIWLILAVVGVFYTIHALRDTRRGYVWSTHWLVTSALVISVGLGAVVHASGASERLDTFFLREMPLYRPLSGFHSTHWMNPERGVYVGVVLSASTRQFEIETIEGEIVKVFLSEETHLPQRKQIQEGMPVRVFGATSDEGLFVASEVTPFMGRGRLLPASGRRMDRYMQERGQRIFAPRERFER